MKSECWKQFMEEGVMDLSSLRTPASGRFRSGEKLLTHQASSLLQCIQWPLEASSGSCPGSRGWGGGNISTLYSSRAGIWDEVSLVSDSTLLVSQHQETSLCYHIFKFFDLLIFFRVRGRKREREKHWSEKHQPGASCMPPTGDWACALTWNETSDLLVHWWILNQLSHTCQGDLMFFYLTTVTHYLNHCPYHGCLFSFLFTKINLFLTATLDWKANRFNCSLQNANRKTYTACTLLPVGIHKGRIRAVLLLAMPTECWINGLSSGITVFWIIILVKIHVFYHKYLLQLLWNLFFFNFNNVL